MQRQETVERAVAAFVERNMYPMEVQMEGMAEKVGMSSFMPMSIPAAWFLSFMSRFFELWMVEMVKEKANAEVMLLPERCRFRWALLYTV
jgi:hypothetical protein